MAVIAGLIVIVLLLSLQCRIRCSVNDNSKVVK